MLMKQNVNNDIMKDSPIRLLFLAFKQYFSIASIHLELKKVDLIDFAVHVEGPAESLTFNQVLYPLMLDCFQLQLVSTKLIQN